MNKTTFLSRLFRSKFHWFAAFLLIELIWIEPAFCGEIHDAAQAGDLEKIKALLLNNPKLVFSKNNESLTPLHLAALEGHKEVVELLLVNAIADQGLSPLPGLLYMQIHTRGERSEPLATFLRPLWGLGCCQLVSRWTLQIYPSHRVGVRILEY
jgi:hypothetical protein